MSSITNVVFDFGGVIAPANIGVVHDRFVALGVKEIDKYINLITQEGFFGDFESGLIGPEEFACRVSQEAGHEVSLEECRHACRGFFSVIPQRNLDLLKRLRSEGYRVSLLSNTNPFVTAWTLSKDFDGQGNSLADYLDSLYLSYEQKVMKPNPQIFLNMLEGEGVAPEKVLFVDDGQRNVDAARKLGINAIKVENSFDVDWTVDVLKELENL